MSVLRQLFASLGGWLVANEPLLSAVGVIVGLAAVAIGIVRHFRQPRPSVDAKHDFEMLWPRFSATLKQDIANAIEYTEQSRAVVDNAGHGPALHILIAEVSNGNTFSNDHWRAIGRYDLALANELSALVKAMDALRATANARNQLMYRGKFNSPEYDLALAELLAASNRLEGIADHLKRRARFFDEKIGLKE